MLYLYFKKSGAWPIFYLIGQGLLVHDSNLAHRCEFGKRDQLKINLTDHESSQSETIYVHM